MMAKPVFSSLKEWFRHGLIGSRPADNDHVLEEQLRMIWEHSRTALLVAMAFALSLAWSLRGVAASVAMVDSWLAVKLGISAFRAFQGWRFLKQPVASGPRWANATLASLIVDASVWGAAGLYVALTAPLSIVSFVSAVLACISCVATFGLQVSARFTAGYSAPLLAPTAIGLMLRGEGLEQLGGVGILLLLVLQLSTAVRSEKRLAESIQLRWRAEALAQEKDDALRTAMRQSAVKTQFLANISHELRTPLHGILGMAQLVRLGDLEPVLQRRVDLIESSGQHLLGLINDLLDISRIEAGQFVIRAEVFDLAAQIEQLNGIYAMRAEDKGLRFELRNALPAPCWVAGDPARFRQVLHNLLGNAIKFTERGGITLTLIRDESIGMVCATVHDTGIGIPHASLGRIFEPFQQVDDGSKPASSMTEGAGLGLAIARDIARAMGGDIHAESDVGKGSTLIFSACLPATSPLALDAAPADPGVQCDEIEPGAPSRSLVLLAEDNDINALVAANFLDIIGTEMERVKNGEEAVQAALRETPRPHLVLMDCHMPKMDGYEATREIRAQEQLRGLPRLPIVALTATASDAERQDCLDAGMDDYLSKPCTLEELRHAVQHWATLPEPAPPPATTPAPDEEDAAREGSPAYPGATCRA
jgi:signal transduction histidine kinase/ActR/RegA family two-component response regulator